jgi:hypothetical protein
VDGETSTSTITRRADGSIIDRTDDAGQGPTSGGGGGYSGGGGGGGSGRMPIGRVPIAPVADVPGNSTHGNGVLPPPPDLTPTTTPITMLGGRWISEQAAREDALHREGEGRGGAADSNGVLDAGRTLPDSTTTLPPLHPTSPPPPTPTINANAVHLQRRRQPTRPPPIMPLLGPDQGVVGAFGTLMARLWWGDGGKG